MTQPVSSREEIEELLARERAGFMAQFGRVAEARRAVRPAAGGWSAAEVVEHVARVEAGVAKMLQKGATMPLTTTAEAAAAQITPRKIAIVRDRSAKVEAPARTHPEGDVTGATAITALLRSREAMLAAFHETDARVLDGITFPHPFVGPLTLRAWVELIAHHDARHAAQIAEIADGTAS
jgi:hypothetical protein